MNRATERSFLSLLVVIGLVGTACSSNVEQLATVPAAVQYSGFPAASAYSSRADRIHYPSIDAAGRDSVVTGTLFVPRGEAPDGGWPIIVYAHGTIGLDPGCAPSLSPDLRGALPTVIALLQHGYVVVAPDLEGLGNGRPHPYLDQRSAGANVVDAAKAAHTMVSGASRRWLGVGISQGGQAVWAANEGVTNDARGLDLLGTISVSAPVDVTDVVDEMERGTLGPERIAILPILIHGLAVSDPDVRPDRLMRGVLDEQKGVFLACTGDRDQEKVDQAERVVPADYRPASPSDASAFRTALESQRLPQFPAAAPMLVAYGGADALVAAGRTRAAIAAACGMGDRITVISEAKAGHSFDISNVALDWLAARVRGTPVRDDCRRK